MTPERRLELKKQLSNYTPGMHSWPDAVRELLADVERLERIIRGKKEEVEAEEANQASETT